MYEPCTFLKVSRTVQKWSRLIDWQKPIRWPCWSFNSFTKNLNWWHYSGWLSCHCGNESSCKWKKFMLVLAQSVTLSATSWSTEKHVQNGFQKSWHNYIRTQCWSVAQSWRSIMKEKVRLPQQIFILWWNLSSLLRAEINGKAWSGVEAHHISCRKKYKNQVSAGKVMLTVFGERLSFFCDKWLSWRSVHNKQPILLGYHFEQG